MGIEAIIGEGGSLTHIFGGTELDIARQKKDAGLDDLNDHKILQKDFESSMEDLSSRLTGLESRINAAKAKHGLTSGPDKAAPEIKPVSLYLDASPVTDLL